MDPQKEQSIKDKLEAIKCENETSEVRIRKLKSLINQMNLRLAQNPDEKPIILVLQKLGYEAIVYILNNDTESSKDETQQHKDKIVRLIDIVDTEIKHT